MDFIFGLIVGGTLVMFLALLIIGGTLKDDGNSNNKQ